MKYLKCIFNCSYAERNIWIFILGTNAEHSKCFCAFNSVLSKVAFVNFRFPECVHKAGWGTVLCVIDKKPLCTACHACRGTQYQSLSHSAALIKQLPPQPQSRGCSRESATLIWAGLFLAAMDCERALVLFQSYTGWAWSPTITVFGAPWVCSHFPQAYISTTWMDINLTNSLQAFLHYISLKNGLLLPIV